MTLRKLTSLVMMIGLMVSLFHPLAHARSQQSPDHHGHHSGAIHHESGHESASPFHGPTMDQIDGFHDTSSQDHERSFVASHCEVCHVFAHLYAVGEAEKGHPTMTKRDFAGLVSLPAMAPIHGIDRPPRQIG